MGNPNILKDLLSIAAELECEKLRNCEEGKLSKKLFKSISRVNQTGLRKYELHPEDIIILSLITANLFQYDRNLNTRRLLDQIRTLGIDYVRILDRIVSLMQKDILEPGEKRFRRLSARSNKVRLVIDRTHILEYDITLSEKFRSYILGDKNDITDDKPTVYVKNEEYLTDWFEYVIARREYTSNRSYNLYDESGQNANLYKANQLRDRLRERTALTPKEFPFQRLAAEYELDEKEQVALIYLLHEGLGGSPCDIDELIDLIADNRFSRYGYRRYFLKDSKLCRKKLIEINDQVDFRRNGGEIAIAQDLIARIMDTEPSKDKEKLMGILRGDDLLSLINPRFAFKTLILKPELIDLIKSGISQFENKHTEVLTKWGILGNKSSDIAKPSPNSLLLLFQGPPGTGKTYAAHCVASEMNKSLLVTDISKILSCLVGESEQNIRRLFRKIERINLEIENPPVLLLNEADQFFTMRGTAEQSVDRMYNQMQNLLLEALEDFNGILIATTNLQRNFDTAFSRRFHLKLEFPVPEYEERKRLWRLHLPENLPLAKDVDIEKLSDHFRLTGGQIAVVVKNAAASAASRIGARRKVYQSDLVKYCKLEMESSFDSISPKQIGFRNRIGEDGFAKVKK